MYTVSPKHKRNLDQWYKDIKKQLTSKAHENYFKRLQEIIAIANIKLSHYDSKLKVNSAERALMWNGIANDIDSWKGVEITACTKQKTNYKSYAITSRNWWNRNKAKVYGNHFFYPIIFVYIKEVVYRLEISDEEKSFLFVDIFDEILHAKIQFPQTRAQPIIPHQSFIQPNKFKYSSIDLLKMNGIHWTGKNIDSVSGGRGQMSALSSRFSDEDSTSTNSSNDSINNISNSNASMGVQRQSYYIKDKDRSLKVNNSFMDSLVLLKHRLHDRLRGHCRLDQVHCLKIKSEVPVLPMQSYVKTEQCLPPSIAKRQSNMASLAARSLLLNPNINNNHNPVIVSRPNINIYPSVNSMNINTLSPPSVMGTIPDINGLKNGFSFPPTVTSATNNGFMSSVDIQSLINTIASNTTSPQSQSTNMSPKSGDTSPQMNALLNSLLLPNNNHNCMNNMYAPQRGQSNSVSQQRFSPTMFQNVLPFNLQNIPNSYCSINTVSGQLTLSLHIPLN